MEVEKLRKCPIDVAKSVLYERFHKQAGAFTHIWEPPEYSATLFTLSFELPMTSQEMFLIDHAGQRAAIFSVMTASGDVYVLVDTVLIEQPNGEEKTTCYATVTSDDEAAMYAVLADIVQIATYSELRMQNWLRSQRGENE
jgi:hypothetical protein